MNQHSFRNSRVALLCALGALLPSGAAGAPPPARPPSTRERKLSVMGSGFVSLERQLCDAEKLNTKTAGATRCILLDEKKQLLFLWTPLKYGATDDEEIDMWVRVVRKAGDTASLSKDRWLGLGWSKTGSMKGADMFVFRKKNDVFVVEDYFSEDFARPVLDARQDYKLVHGSEDANGVHLHVRRKKGTCDHFFDEAFTRDANPFLLWAHGADGGNNFWSYHGSGARGAAAVVLFDRPIPVVPAGAEKADILMSGKTGEGAGRVASEITIPTRSIAKGVSANNQYVCSYKTAKEMFPNDPEENPRRMAVSFGPKIPAASYPYVHHILVFACDASVARTLDKDAVNYNCRMQRCFGEQVAGWAVGAVPRVFPEDQGFWLGGDGTPMYEIQTHYFNRNLDEGIKDMSGISWDVLPRGQARPVIQETFLNVFMFQNLEPLKPDVEVSNTCPAECLEQYWDAREVFVEAAMHHGHFDTKKMTFSKITHAYSARGSKANGWPQVEPAPDVKLYDYNHQTIVNWGTWFTRGQDGIMAQCMYDFQARRFPMMWGDGSDQEMCVHAVTYQPAQAMGIFQCAIDIDETVEVTRKWTEPYRKSAANFCDLHCAYDEVQGFYKNADEAKHDLFRSEVDEITDVVDQARNSAKALGFGHQSTWDSHKKPKPWAEKEFDRHTFRKRGVDLCTSCNSTALVDKLVECPTCRANGVTNDCDKLVYKGVCNEKVQVKYRRRTNDGNSIAKYAENYVRQREDRVCNKYCAIGKDEKPLFQCRRNRIVSWGEPAREGSMFTNTENWRPANVTEPVWSPARCKLEKDSSGRYTEANKAGAKVVVAPVQTNQCASHAGCQDEATGGNSYSYCVDAQKGWKKHLTPSDNHPVLNWCGSCTRCCALHDGVRDAAKDLAFCPASCNCKASSLKCFNEDKLFCDGGVEKATGTAVAPFCATDSFTNRKIRSTFDCASACGASFVHEWALWRPKTRSCLVCEDDNATFKGQLKKTVDMSTRAAGLMQGRRLWERQLLLTEDRMLMQGRISLEDFLDAKAGRAVAKAKLLKGKTDPASEERRLQLDMMSILNSQLSGADCSTVPDLKEQLNQYKAFLGQMGDYFIKMLHDTAGAHCPYTMRETHCSQNMSFGKVTETSSQKAADQKSLDAVFALWGGSGTAADAAAVKAVSGSTQPATTADGEPVVTLKQVVVEQRVAATMTVPATATGADLQQDVVVVKSLKAGLIACMKRADADSSITPGDITVKKIELVFTRRLQGTHAGSTRRLASARADLKIDFEIVADSKAEVEATQAVTGAANVASMNEAFKKAVNEEVVKQVAAIQSEGGSAGLIADSGSFGVLQVDKMATTATTVRESSGLKPAGSGASGMFAGSSVGRVIALVVGAIVVAGIGF